MKLILLVVVATLFGCQSPEDQNFQCDNKQTIQIAFDQEHATLKVNGSKWTLPQQVTASGFAYANQQWQIRGKGESLQLTTPSAEQWSCHQKIRAKLGFFND